MSRKLDVFIADSSGNITVMVVSPVDRCDYKSVAQALLDNEALGGEQVAFLVSEELGVDAIDGAGISRMEMCGLEFCGNASRAFALYSADGPEVSVSVSGCAHSLDARISDIKHSTGLEGADGYVSATVEMDMPIPSGVRVFTGSELGISKDGLLVDMDGIYHLILTDVAPLGELFDDIKSRIYEVLPDMPAFGVMFCDTINRMMTPVVYVKDVDSTYFEGSCASGSVAASFALSMDRADGVHDFILQQPEGMLYSTVKKEKGRIEGITLKGLVTLSDIITVEV